MLLNIHKITYSSFSCSRSYSYHQYCAYLDMIGMLHISNKSLNPSSLITPLSFGEVVGGEALILHIKHYISVPPPCSLWYPCATFSRYGLSQVYRLTIFPWCQPQLLQFNQTVESSHYRKGCLNSSNTKYRISLGVYLVFVNHRKHSIKHSTLNTKHST